MVRLFNQLSPDSQLYLLSELEAAHSDPATLKSVDGPSSVTRSQKLFALLDHYQALPRGEVLNLTVRALVAQHIVVKLGMQPTDDIQDWLIEKARATLPWDDEVAKLIGFARDLEGDIDFAMFPDGLVSGVLSSSECEYSVGEGMLAGYDYIKSTSDLGYDFPDPFDFLHVRVDKKDFSFLDAEAGWALDEDAYKEEVRHQCILKFASYVATWRAKFFKAVLSDHF